MKAKFPSGGIPFALAAALLACAMATSGVQAADPASRIVHADSEPQNWLTTGRTYDESRNSPLDTINDGNVQNLGLVWSYDLSPAEIESIRAYVIDRAQIEKRLEAAR